MEGYTVVDPHLHGLLAHVERPRRMENDGTCRHTQGDE
jgi:hypothetical protein